MPRKEIPATRPPATAEDDKQMTFIVEPGFIVMGFEDPPEKHKSGDKVVLTQGQAAHLQKIGAITVDMGALFNDDDEDPAAKEPSNSEGGGPDDTKAKAGVKSPADRVRKSAVRAATRKEAE